MSVCFCAINPDSIFLGMLFLKILSITRRTSVFQFFCDAHKPSVHQMGHSDNEMPSLYKYIYIYNHWTFIKMKKLTLVHTTLLTKLENFLWFPYFFPWKPLSCSKTQLRISYGTELSCPLGLCQSVKISQSFLVFSWSWHLWRVLVSYFVKFLTGLSGVFSSLGWV